MARRMLLRARRLFDGQRLVERPWVLVGDGKVEQVGGPPTDAEVLDLGDVTVLPGLVDAHTHLVFDASADPVARVVASGDDELLTLMRQQAGASLRGGVTTVRDLGDRGYLALRLREENLPDAPEILAAGPPITSHRGHCWFLGGETAGTPEHMRAAVRQRATHGVHAIKIMVTGGAMTPGTPPHRAQFGTPELFAAVEQAHQAGLPIAAHAHGAEGIAQAVEVGFDTIEHCSFFGEHGIQPDPELIQRLADSGVTVSLTLGLLPGTPLPPAAAGFEEVVAGLRSAGVTVICSSDSGIHPAKPHGTLAHSAAAMVEYGYSPPAALRAVTSDAAAACRVGDRKGRIAPGYDADLIAVAGDPLTDIGTLATVTEVFRKGRRIAEVGVPH